MSTNPAEVYQRRILHAVGRLAEIVQILRPIAGGTQNVTVRPLIVAASSTIIKGVTSSGTGGGGAAAFPGGTPPPSGSSSGSSSSSPALLAPGDIYAGYMAELLAGDTALRQPDSLTLAATTQVIPALLLVQDVFQNPVAVGDVFTRDGSSWTVNVFGDQLIAGLNIAVLSIALRTP